MQIPYPHGLGLIEWADAAMSALTNYTSITPLVDADWQSWGMFFFNNPQLALLGPPNPYEYQEWEPWAERLADALNNASNGFSGNTFENSNFLLAFSGAPLLTEANQFILVQFKSS